MCRQPGAWTIHWDGPFIGHFLSNGIVHSRFASMQEARDICESIYSCAGLTGRLRGNHTYEWEVRTGNGVWMERSPSHEISWRHRPTLFNHLNYSHLDLSFQFISLPRRKDRRIALLDNFAIAGFAADEVRWSKGVDRDSYESADVMLLSHSYASVVAWHFDEGDVRSPRVKGKIGCWLGHLNIWRELSTSENRTRSSLELPSQVVNASAWTVIMEDDVLFVDSKADFIDKISVTSLLNPEADIIYLTGRELPAERPLGRLGYVGTDAYAIKRSSAARVLSLCLLDSPGTKTLALDAHLSALSIAGVIEARALVGGNAFVNRWSETPSDVEVSSRRV